MCVRVLVLVGSRVCECTCGYACSWARVYVCVRADAPSGEMRMRRMWCASAQVGKSICEWEKGVPTTPGGRSADVGCGMQIRDHEDLYCKMPNNWGVVHRVCKS